MPNGTLNPLALPAEDAARMLRRSGCPHMSDERLRLFADEGLPLNAHGDYTGTFLALLNPFALVCGVLGLVQLVRRKSLLKVDPDIILLGIYYILVIFGYLFFEMVPINYRPILIEGRMEASYPSSTTLLVLSVMPTLKFQVDRRSGNPKVRTAATVFTVAFSAFMVIGRLIAGVHWATDILGSVLLSAGLFLLYVSAVSFADGKKQPAKGEERQ